MLAREGPLDWHMSIVLTLRDGVLSFSSLIKMLSVAVPVILGLPGDKKTCVIHFH